MITIIIHNLNLIKFQTPVTGQLSIVHKCTYRIVEIIKPHQNIARRGSRIQNSGTNQVWDTSTNTNPFANDLIIMQNRSSGISNTVNIL